MCILSLRDSAEYSKQELIDMITTFMASANRDGFNLTVLETTKQVIEALKEDLNDNILTTYYGKVKLFY